MKRRAAALVTAAAGLLAGCTAATSGHGLAGRPTSPPARTSAPTTSSPTRPAGSGTPVAGPSGTPAGSCASYAVPDPHRPRMTVVFTIAADHRSVQGREHIVFRPDKPIRELVFRLTANTPPTVDEGNRIVVTSARADHGGGRFGFAAAGADPSTQGGLLRIPFASTVPAGTVVTADMAFRLTLGSESFDRFGTAGRFAYFASAQPLLAWQRGYGWHDEDLIRFPAESATSEAMAVDLTVIAPAGDTVIMSGDPVDPPVTGRTRSWHAALDAARDVSVAAGPFVVSDTRVGAVRLRVGAPSAAVRDELVPEFRRAVVELSKRYGPFPFPSLSVARLPAAGGGIEYPGSVLMLDGSRTVAVHETAHQWFYAMVGNSQALHPWLDEAFAQYSEELVDGVSAETRSALGSPGIVDRSTESYGNDEAAYYYVTYSKGAAALFAARAAAGPARWDAALRCYVARNAWRIADPSDLRAALVRLPAAVAVLRRAGALR